MMRVNTLVMHLEPDQAYALIEFIDQLRERLLESYGDNIKAMLQEATAQTSRDEDDDGNDVNDHDPF
jgi:hypothetical protein